MACNQRRRILIVDDSEQESAELVELLESLGYQVSATWSGRDALNYLASERFDALLVDQYVADIYVGELIERVLALPTHPRVAIMRGTGTCKPIRYNKALAGCHFLDKGQPEGMCQTLRTEFPEIDNGPVN